MIIAVIPAKGGSNRLPNKNMYPLAGKPMIFYAIRLAKESSLIEDIYVSTDTDEIAKYSEEQGVKVIRRGEDLAGETPVADVYYHALNIINNPKIKVVVGIQPDHPDRSLDLDKAIEYLFKKDCDELISVDREGFRNGALWIMRAETILNRRIARVASIMVDCTNIHTLNDLKKAEENLSKREDKNRCRKDAKFTNN